MSSWLKRMKDESLSAKDNQSLVSNVTGVTFVRTPIGRKLHGHHHTPRNNTNLTVVIVILRLKIIMDITVCTLTAAAGLTTPPKHHHYSALLPHYTGIYHHYPVQSFTPRPPSPNYFIAPAWPYVNPWRTSPPRPLTPSKHVD